jgi:hypothetical protein
MPPTLPQIPVTFVNAYTNPDIRIKLISATFTYRNQPPSAVPVSAVVNMAPGDRVTLHSGRSCVTNVQGSAAVYTGSEFVGITPLNSGPPPQGTNCHSNIEFTFPPDAAPPSNSADAEAEPAAPAAPIADEARSATEAVAPRRPPRKRARKRGENG